MSTDETVFSTIDPSGNCANCGLWIHDITVWCCDECTLFTCESCGKVEEDMGLFLCPDCFLLT